MSDADVAARVDVATDVLGHPHYMAGYSEELMDEHLPVREGTHYTVLASTLWGDYFVPTVVEWAHGAVDSFADRGRSLRHRERARRVVQEDVAFPEERKNATSFAGP
jgi:hypothetical protein